jgi:hypothetical protein
MEVKEIPTLETYFNTQLEDPSHKKSKREPNNVVAAKIYIRDLCLRP